MLVGVLAAFQLARPEVNMGNAYTTFGRIRPLHTNTVIFAFVGNGIFTGVYYSLQRLCKARMFSDVLGKIHFWDWQLIIVSAVISLPLGLTTSKEYAELEWPVDIAITVVWVVFGWDMFGTIARRRERHLYVGIWFYIATFLTVAVLHIVNSMALPVSFMKSYSMYAGVQDALFSTRLATTHFWLGTLTFLVFIVLFTVVYGRVFCGWMCPYGRLQGVLLDQDSLVVAYDYKRGEPREKLHKNQARTADDCIGCHQCVQMCPPGIDIRNGATQMECVNCTACIDACDAIMDLVQLPQGLIRHASENGIAKGPDFQQTPVLIIPRSLGPALRGSKAKSGQ